MTNQVFGGHYQQGMVLVIGLIFLLLMTVLGVTSIQTTTLDERMAANLRDKNIAFQAAEAGLRDAEKLVATLSTPQLLQILTTENPDPVDDTWDNQQTNSVNVDGVSAQPTYAIEKLADFSSALEFNDVSGLYRVTSRGKGATPNAVVVLQTSIGRGNVGE